MKKNADAMGGFLGEVFDPVRQADRKSRIVRKPWWQVTKTVRQGFMISGAYLALAIGAFIAFLMLRSNLVVPMMFAVLWLVFSACYLASAVALRIQLRGQKARSRL
jgi:hypothetical protein